MLHIRFNVRSSVTTLHTDYSLKSVMLPSISFAKCLMLENIFYFYFGTETFDAMHVFFFFFSLFWTYSIYLYWMYANDFVRVDYNVGKWKSCQIKHVIILCSFISCISSREKKIGITRIYAVQRYLFSFTCPGTEFCPFFHCDLHSQ